MSANNDFDIAFILNSTLGGTPRWFGTSFKGKSFPVALKLSLSFFSVFVALPLAVGIIFGKQMDWTLISLSVWGAAYIFFVAWIAKSTSLRVEREVDGLLEDSSTTNWMNEAKLEINSRFGGWLPDAIAFIAAIVGLALTIGALAVDKGYIHFTIGQAKFPNSTHSFGPAVIEIIDWKFTTWEWVFFGFGFFFLYYLAARCTFVATFYLMITSRICTNVIKDSYDPINSKPVRCCMDLSRSILLFWTGIAMSIATLPLAFRELENFLQMVVSTTVFFSLGVGTAVYIVSEQQIRRAVRGAVTEKLEAIHREIGKILSTGSPANDQVHRHAFLKEQIDRLTADAGIKSYLLTALSLILPLVGIVVKILTA